MLTFKNFNIADWFSFYRVLAAPFLIVLLYFGHAPGLGIWEADLLAFAQGFDLQL